MIWTHDEVDRRFQPTPSVVSAATKKWDWSATLRRSPILRGSLAGVVGLGFLVYLVGLGVWSARTR